MFGIQAFGPSPTPDQMVTGNNIANSSDRSTMKVYVYDIPAAYNKRAVQKDPRCLAHMFATEIKIHTFLHKSEVRTFVPEEADWFFTPIYTNCDLSDTGLPLINRVPQMMQGAITYISTHWPYWNQSRGANHFFVVPHDFGACFHFQEMAAVRRGIFPLLREAALVQTFGQIKHPCMTEKSIIIPPYVPLMRISRHSLPPGTLRSIFAYFRGTIYDMRNDPQGGYYARGVRAAMGETFKDNPLFDMSIDHPTTYYEDMQRSIFCLCPRGWAPWSPRIVEAVIYGCIPVIIADNIVLPFEGLIPWRKLAVFVKERDVGMLESILTSIPAMQVKEKQGLLADTAIKRALLFPKVAMEGDAFHLMLASLSKEKISHT
ncbi:hypothetical protein GOP47_0016428 [Adiantum capillus-veneris]|uniref:Exostosin GT47 domain-containing protein n=1 Tax=Adiantum capillus-veneris TaxID=13818 RepID=A0A9D4UHM2_ADICA|nr:hypothetical protein GOP47_0016428 [Adiantum capillus-veneris]